MRTIAVFDFDGTITTRDTLFDFICFYHGKIKLFVGLSILSPILILFKLGLIRNSKAKQILFSFFFKGVKATDFDSICEKYSNRINEILNKNAIEKIMWHQSEGHDVIIDSASISNWIKPWASSLGITTVIGTEIDLKDEIISGVFSSENCYGQEKVNRFIEIYPERELYQLYVYGDSAGDKELLSIADFPFYRRF